jgi:transposase-like protein
MTGAKGHGEKFTRKKEQAIAALLAHPTVPAAAQTCGVSESTLWRWLQQAAFQQRYRAAQRAVVDGAIKDLQAATVEAVATLRRNLNCKNVFAENAAALAIISHALKAVEMGELAERIKRLEAVLQPDAGTKRRRA